MTSTIISITVNISAKELVDCLTSDDTCEFPISHLFAKKIAYKAQEFVTDISFLYVKDNPSFGPTISIVRKGINNENAISLHIEVAEVLAAYEKAIEQVKTDVSFTIQIPDSLYTI